MLKKFHLNEQNISNLEANIIGGIKGFGKGIRDPEGQRMYKGFEAQRNQNIR